MAALNGIVQPNFNAFLQSHERQLRSCGIPGHFWKKLHEKLVNESYDAHRCVMLNRVIYENEDDSDAEEDADADSTQQFEWQVTVSCEELLQSDPTNIFLIDHAWTFESSSIRGSLENVPGLKERMASLMDLNVDDPAQEVNAICNSVWKFARHYKLSQSEHTQLLRLNPELQHLRWYVLDEVGSRIGHSDKPTARMVPFFYAPRGICYSVFWPIRDLHKDDLITVDYVEHVKDISLRPYFLLPWEPEDHSEEPVAHSYTLTDEFFESHRVQETLPDPNYVPARLSGDSALLVYSELSLIRSHLTDPRFTLTDKQDDAQILWFFDHFKDFAKLSTTTPAQYVNQFPGEHVLTVKDLLAALASIHSGRKDSSVIVSDSTATTTADLERHLTTDWYPVTFNLVYELPQFVAYFQRKQNEIEAFSRDHECVTDVTQCSPNCPRYSFSRDRGESNETANNPAQRNNVWILKPWNAGRGLGITVSDNLNQIIRLCDTNPLIASRYVTDPVLFYRDDIQANVKFDVRYVVLLHSVHPLKLFAYNVFWLRFANQPFGLMDFDNYGKHFTVMNYRDDENLKQMHCDEFVQLFDQQYPGVTWSTVQTKIFNVLVDMFTAASAHPPPKGISACAQSRALYAVDLMLEWRSNHSVEPHSCDHDIAPIVCEVNYSPDCTRACKYHPEFFNHVFSCLFLEDPPEQCNMTQLV